MTLLTLFCFCFVGHCRIKQITEAENETKKTKTEKEKQFEICFGELQDPFPAILDLTK